MASKILCSCGTVLRINLYEGHGLNLLVPEALTENTNLKSSDELLDQIVLSSKVVVECSSCGALSVVDNSLNIKSYTPLVK